MRSNKYNKGKSSIKEDIGLFCAYKRYCVIHMGEKGGGIVVWDRFDRKVVAKRFKSFANANRRAERLNREWVKRFKLGKDILDEVVKTWKIIH